MTRPMTRILSRAAALAAFALCLGAPALAAPPAAAPKPPNILFIMMDDVGIDQLQMFNPLAPTAVHAPVLEQIAAQGVKFDRFYTMPECSPSRTAFLTGRYPLRTGVTAALLPEDLPAAQISPYEMAIPKVLKQAGYSSAMLGKYHLGGPDNNPDGYRTPVVLGWDYYSGNLSGGPPAIDATLGGQIADKTRYTCGFPIQASKGGCWFLGTNKRARFDNKGGAGYDGKECATLGGIAALDGDGDFTMTCGPNDHCKTPDLTAQNAYYAWERVTVQGNGVQRSIVRKYMTTAQTDESIAWIKQQAKGASAGRPWMATVSYNADHILYQPPPADMYPPGAPPRVPDTCDGLPEQRVISNRMIEAMDRDIGRLLVSIGLAQQGPGEAIVYTPQATNTMIVIVGDNGSFLPSVKYPYNLTRSKASVYETGVLTPLIVAGPLVNDPGRTVHALTSAADLFQLFGEIGGVDVRDVVPESHVLDSEPMLAYLENPAQPDLRSHVFTQVGDGLKPPSSPIPPCLFEIAGEKICTDILLTTEDLCTGAGGTPLPADSCCAYVDAHPSEEISVVPRRSWGIRNDAYKLVQVDRPACDSELGPYELYKLAPQPLHPTNPLGIDNADDNLMLAALDAEAQANFDELVDELDAVLASEPACPGDGNLDKRVDQLDVIGVQAHKGAPSVFDFDANGMTDEADLATVEAHLGTVCSASPSGAP